MFASLADGAASFPESLPETVGESGLEARDAALARAVLEGAVRHWTALEFLLDVFLRAPVRTLEPALRGALLGGVAQIVTLERVPAHAAIDTSVEWAKRRIRPGAGAMVNAVLRRVAELVLHGEGGGRVRRARWSGGRDELPTSGGGALVLARAVLPGPDLERLAVATSHPLWLVERWTRRFGAEAARALCAHSLVRAPAVLNTQFARSAVNAPSGAGGIAAHTLPGAMVVDLGRAALAEVLDGRVDIWVQDAASAMAVRSVAQLRARLVVDLCAGRGTKTRQLAMTFPDATVLASDPDPDRFGELARVAGAYPNVRAVSAAQVRSEAAGRADLVVLDVPCSNTGVLARRLGAKHRCGGEQLARLGGVQRSILRDGAGLRAPSGVVLYSTCSLDDEENAALVRAAGADVKLGVIAESLALPSGLPGEDPAHYHDGAYSAVLGP